MSGPPDWDDIPPADYGQGGTGGGGGKAARAREPAMTAQQMAAASADFYTWLETPATLSQLKMILPEHVDLGVFVATAKTAVLNKPQLLREAMRQSLLVAIMKAAGQGLLPDGKQGALVPRYDGEVKAYIVSWQPMVGGIIKLGRETGSIKTIRAAIVFNGEKFHVMAGEDDRIEHEVDIDIVDEAYQSLNNGRDTHGNPIAKPDEFMKRVRAAYCFITSVDGTVTKRYMTRGRLVSLWESSKASFGPWNSRWIDEMIVKGVILYTAKWVNLDTASASAKRFQAALLTDLEIDFDRQGQLTTLPTKQAALPAPADKLSTLEDQIAAGAAKKATQPRETVAANNVSAGGNSPAQERTATAGEAGARSAAASPGQTNGKPAQDKLDERTFAQKVRDVLEKEGRGHRWLSTLIAATQACPTADDLQTIRTLPSVLANLKEAPPEIRSQIGVLLAGAANRLAEVVGDPESDSAEDAWTAPQEAAD